MKICYICHIEKSQDQFYPSQGDCKECVKKRVRKNRNRNIKYYRAYDLKRQRESLNRIFNNRYSSMLSRIEGRTPRKYNVMGKGICTKEEFAIWCNKKIKSFRMLHALWKKSGWSSSKVPSIDRIDNNKGYTIDNIQWITKSKNSKKYTS